ncbi:MAG: DUF4231 domain-containing protein [Oscillatoriales cyanobacterium C42_A2020_001]|nr:DUF4231 domain-containing protein [Leptolyngbyaceae cyanobacterium C42_A2020_001]
MSRKNSYEEVLRQEFGQLVDSLELQERQKYYLKSRWLDQVLWMESRASRARNFYYRLRLTTIIGGVIIPALVSLNFTSTENQQVKQAIAISTFALSQVVAVSAAVEQFFNYGERWRHYRRSVETLKTQGWQFFELGGIYEPFANHDQAFNDFAGNVEAIIQRDVEIYSTQVVQAKKESTSKSETQSASENGLVSAHVVHPSPATVEPLLVTQSTPTVESVMEPFPVAEPTSVIESAPLVEPISTSNPDSSP